MSIAGVEEAVLIRLRLLSEGVSVPKYATAGSAGMDLEANEEVTLKPFHRAVVGTGIAIAMPHGYEAQIRPRSGLAINYGITVLNSPATIDSDYRGELGVILINLGQQDFVVLRRMRIAQMIISRVVPVKMEVVTGDFDTTERGSGGFGSTGLHSL